MELRNASFLEDVFQCRSKEEPSSLKRVLETINGNSQNQDKDGEVEPRRNKRVRVEKYFSLDFLIYVLEGEPLPFKERVSCGKKSLIVKLIPYYITILRN